MKGASNGHRFLIGNLQDQHGGAGPRVTVKDAHPRAAHFLFLRIAENPPALRPRRNEAPKAKSEMKEETFLK
ncbi:hypothetical protein EYF80_061258 [Liparis tanakae]|uniref:Uncharacterized protein n=1 Tax=Liparis tanakae TaxID=230148 RepID=A0A4Z2EJI2_9TELE|nr:hypothetical protein EYF80_061258 [Liparis tanakae]